MSTFFSLKNIGYQDKLFPGNSTIGISYRVFEISIGLDNSQRFVYILFMWRNLLSQLSREQKARSKERAGKDLKKFVHFQFQQLTKKNIKIPITLYTL